MGRVRERFYGERGFVKSLLLFLVRQPLRRHFLGFSNVFCGPKLLGFCSIRLKQEESEETGVRGEGKEEEGRKTSHLRTREVEESIGVGAVDL
jgi:hypothetical protein